MKTAPGLGLFSLIEVGDFFGELSLEDGRLFFVLGDFSVEFVESFAAGSKDGNGHGRKVFKNLFLFLNFDYILLPLLSLSLLIYLLFIGLYNLNHSVILSFKY